MNIRKIKQKKLKSQKQQTIIMSSSKFPTPKIYNKDCLNSYDHIRVNSVDMFFVDPPYYILDLDWDKSWESDVEYYGLRFGTVNGCSPVLRTDVMINAMVSSALRDGHIKLYIKDTMRPILGINDLCRAITSIVEFDEDKRGLYNLASFNKTAEQIAYEVADVMGVEVKEYEADPTQVKNVKSQTKAYNFSISTLKFRKEFKFKFQDTVESLTKDLKENWDTMTKTDRSEAIYYE